MWCLTDVLDGWSRWLAVRSEAVAAGSAVDPLATNEAITAGADIELHSGYIVWPARILRGWLQVERCLGNRVLHSGRP